MNHIQPRALHGSCLCGRVTYAVHDRLEMISHCHCPTCRKAHASAFASAAAVAPESLEFTSGESLLSHYESSPGKRRYFCQSCGSHIYAKIDSRNICLIYIGTLDSEPGPCLSRHIFTQYKVSWYNSQDVIPEYEKWAEETVVDSPEAVNNQGLSTHVSVALNAALRRGTTTSLLLLEIDRFIQYCDNFGDERTAEAIIAATTAITKNIREADTAALYGDSGFAVLLPYTDAAAALMMAERIRKIIQGINSLKQNITASIGIATVAPDQMLEKTPDTETDSLIEHAELALRQARSNGGNQTRHFNTLS